MDSPRYNAWINTIRTLAAASSVISAKSGSQLVLHPLMDKRILNLMGALPESSHFTNHQDRTLQRAALTSILPTPIVQRETKGGTMVLIMRALQESGLLEALHESSLLADMNVIDADNWRAALVHASVGHVPHWPSLIQTISMEIWLRQI
jgi:hypothetical protein